MERDRVTFVSADEMARAIATTGRVALYGILFDTDRADPRPDLRPTLEEIARFLRAHPSLSVIVVGHTDNQGAFDYNVDLSRRRAAAIVALLTREFGIPAARLTPFGAGMAAPVAANDTAGGRAQNRRWRLCGARASACRRAGGREPPWAAAGPSRTGACPGRRQCRGTTPHRPAPPPPAKRPPGRCWRRSWPTKTRMPAGMRSIQRQLRSGLPFGRVCGRPGFAEQAAWPPRRRRAGLPAPRGGGVQHGWKLPPCTNSRSRFGLSQAGACSTSAMARAASASRSGSGGKLLQAAAEAFRLDRHLLAAQGPAQLQWSWLPSRNSPRPSSIRRNISRSASGRCRGRHPSDRPAAARTDFASRAPSMAARKALRPRHARRPPRGCRRSPVAARSCGPRSG